MALLYSILNGGAPFVSSDNFQHHAVSLSIGVSVSLQILLGLLFRLSLLQAIFLRFLILDPSSILNIA